MTKENEFRTELLDILTKYKVTLTLGIVQFDNELLYFHLADHESKFNNIKNMKLSDIKDQRLLDDKLFVYAMQTNNKKLKLKRANFIKGNDKQFYNRRRLVNRLKLFSNI